MVKLDLNIMSNIMSNNNVAGSNPALAMILHSAPHQHSANNRQITTWYISRPAVNTVLANLCHNVSLTYICLINY